MGRYLSQLSENTQVRLLADNNYADDKLVYDGLIMLVITNC